MARTTPAQNPRGCARYTSMERPLRKLHHIHSSVPRLVRICAISAPRPVPRSQSPVPSAWKHWALCQNARLEKSDCETNTHRCQIDTGSIIRRRYCDRLSPHLFVTLSPVEAGYISLPGAVSGCLASSSRSLKKLTKTTLDR